LSKPFLTDLGVNRHGSALVTYSLSSSLHHDESRYFDLPKLHVLMASMRLEKLMLTCLEDEQNRCGSYWEDPNTHFRYKLSCCSDNNLCNWKPFIRPWKYFKSPANIIREQENKNSRRILMTKKPTQNSAGS
ncbi:hypothetical protein E2320_014706, partial [Naja naja]